MKRVNKKKKAFTLIELLAVIVILGIIATIVTATISKVTSNARKQAFKESARGLIRAAESYIGEYILKNHQAPEFPMTFTCDGTSCKYNDIELAFAGEIPKSGSIIADGLKKVEASYLSDGKYCAAGTKTDMQVAESCADIDITKPTVTGEAEGKLLKLTLTDYESGIAAYCVTTTNDSSSCSWIKTTDTYKEHTVSSNGIYYIFAKDKKGNVSSSLELEARKPNFGQQILIDNPTRYTNPTLTTSSNNTQDASGLYSMSVTNGFGGQSTEGTTYYFRGNVTNNYVSFANKTWRIIRINEDGTVRLLLEGQSDDKYKFDLNDHKNYTDMYYSNSDIKLSVENWYSTSIGNNSELADKVAEGDYFCEAAKVKYASLFSSGSATMTLTSSYTPNLVCNRDGNGKGIVSSYVGLITYDEVVLLGGYYNNSNKAYFVYYNSNDVWLVTWTMSPGGQSEETSYIWSIPWNGSIDYYNVESTSKFRPVINLKSTVTVTGTGTSTDPYVVE